MTDVSINRIRIIATIEAVEDNNVYVANVSFKDKPKNSFTIQKPGSFTCEAKAVPAPVARATKARFASGYKLSNGRTIPAVDKAATVPDPKQIRKITATAHASKMGEIVTPSKRPAMY